MRSRHETDWKLAFRRAFPLSRRHVLLLVCPLFGELPDDFFSQPRSFREHIIEPIEYLF